MPWDIDHVVVDPALSKPWSYPEPFTLVYNVDMRSEELISLLWLDNHSLDMFHLRKFSVK